MKKLIFLTIILTILGINYLIADNWEPFPYNKTLIYTHSPYKSYYCNYSNFEFGANEYFDVRFDSMYVDGNSKTYYSDRYRRHQQMPCINDSFDFTYILRDDYFYSPYYFQEDFYTIRNDTAIFTLNFDLYLIGGNLLKRQRRDIFFPLNLQQGDTFTQEFQFQDDTTSFLFVTIKYTSKIEEIILGKKDSVKLFEFYRGWRHNTSESIYDTIHIRLSKNFGFIDFMPFFYLYPKDTQYWWPASFTPHITLVGIKDSLQSLGIQMPDSVTADELFALNVGDVIKYQNTKCPDKSYNRLDSVMSIKRTKDSIFIKYFQIEYDTLNTYIPSEGYKFSSIINAKYSIKEYLDLFNGPTNDFLLFDEYLGDDFIDVQHKLFKKKIVICDGDTITQVALGFDGISVDTSNCIGSFSTDSKSIATYDSKFGLSGFASEGFYCKIVIDFGKGPMEIINDQWPDEVVIVGYRIGNKVCGDISMPDTTTGVKEIGDNVEPILFPNPARDYITVGPYIGWQYQIYDLLGNRVQSGMIESDKINISQLSSGFYTVRFYNAGTQVVEKMMKE